MNDICRGSFQLTNSLIRWAKTYTNPCDETEISRFNTKMEKHFRDIAMDIKKKNNC